MIWLEESRLSDPHSVVSTLAHELGHVHLLADGRCDPTTPDHEPLTDLLAVYFGLGIFVANSAIREVNWRSGGWSGWSIARQGYLSIAEYAHALALYAHARGEHRPRWTKFLRPDVRGLFKTESKHLAARRTHSGGSLTDPTIAQVNKAGAVEWPQRAAARENEDDDPESDIDDQTEGENAERAHEPEPASDQSADKYFTLGEAYAAEGEFEQAVEAYSRALQLNPRDPEALVNRAQMHLSLGQFSKAIDDCSKSLKYDPDGLPARCFRAHSYIWLRRYAEALKDVDEASNRKTQCRSVLPRGLAYFGLAQNRKAIAALNKAWRFAPTWADIFLVRSRAYRALAKTRYADADLAEAIRRDPRLADMTEREARLAGRPLVEQ